MPKNLKYPWATDTYFAFPIMYFHYHDDGPETRQELGKRERDRGSGPLETQIAVSRDGIHWKRYPRPAYIKIGRHEGLDIHKNYIAHGMVRRGEEIWQYYLGSEQYHSSWSKEGREAVFRVVQRFDGFISADTPYTGGKLVTRPLTFEGNRLVLNIDTGATGYAQIGILDEDGRADRRVRRRRLHLHQRRFHRDGSRMDKKRNRCLFAGWQTRAARNPQPRHETVLAAICAALNTTAGRTAARSGVRRALVAARDAPLPPSR